MKLCNSCGQELDESSFHKNGVVKGKQTYKKICKNCCAAYHQKRLTSVPELARYQRREAVRRYRSKKEIQHSRRLGKYNISNEEFELLTAERNGTCHLCGGTDFRMVIDHCHDRNVVRGYLCVKCNSGLGMFNDSVDLLKLAILYLERTNQIAV